MCEKANVRYVDNRYKLYTVFNTLINSFIHNINYRKGKTNRKRNYITYIYNNI